MPAQGRYEGGHADGFAPVLFLLLASLWLSGHFYADLPALSVALLVIAFAETSVPKRWQRHNGKRSSDTVRWAQFPRPSARS